MKDKIKNAWSWVKRDMNYMYVLMYFTLFTYLGLLTYNAFWYGHKGNIPAVTYICTAMFWFLMYHLTQAQLRKSQKIARDSIRGWGETIKQWDEHVKAVQAQVERMKTVDGVNQILRERPSEDSEDEDNEE